MKSINGLTARKMSREKKKHRRKQKKEIHIFVYIYIYPISIFVSSLWHAHEYFFCGFLMKSPVPIKLSKCSSVNIRHASMNTRLFHRSMRLIYVPCTSAVWLSYWWCNRCAMAFLSFAIFPNSPFPSPSPCIFMCQIS